MQPRTGALKAQKRHGCSKLASVLSTGHAGGRISGMERGRADMEAQKAQRDLPDLKGWELRDILGVTAQELEWSVRGGEKSCTTEYPVDTQQHKEDGSHWPVGWRWIFGLEKRKSFVSEGQ